MVKRTASVKEVSIVMPEGYEIGTTGEPLGRRYLVSGKIFQAGLAHERRVYRVPPPGDSPVQLPTIAFAKQPGQSRPCRTNTSTRTSTRSGFAAYGKQGAWQGKSSASARNTRNLHVQGRRDEIEFS
ncbi:hypothetical protein PsYK624_056960 [Phanerochaete sordida]|uniref:Uncharacterized protein n=1 Tax=Phanerochaete sordida TaxID=48140 RepID=A0A9P3LD65_9APHY|nr:hypothetical protein PsYK624_056960 [Phanerochaete sordida]